MRPEDDTDDEGALDDEPWDDELPKGKTDQEDDGEDDTPFAISTGPAAAREKRTRAPKAKKGPSKKAAKPKKPPPRPKLACACGDEVTHESRMFCWDCQEAHDKIVPRLIVEAFAAGKPVGQAIREVYDFADGMLIERGRRLREAKEAKGGQW